MIPNEVLKDISIDFTSEGQYSYDKLGSQSEYDITKRLGWPQIVTLYTDPVGGAHTKVKVEMLLLPIQSLKVKFNNGVCAQCKAKWITTNLVLVTIMQSNLR
jgi:hypothetical protein